MVLTKTRTQWLRVRINFYIFSSIHYHRPHLIHGSMARSFVAFHTARRNKLLNGFSKMVISVEKSQAGLQNMALNLGTKYVRGICLGKR
jgi:hypothetical protein